VSACGLVGEGTRTYPLVLFRRDDTETGESGDRTWVTRVCDKQSTPPIAAGNCVSPTKRRLRGPASRT